MACERSLGDELTIRKDMTNFEDLFTQSRTNCKICLLFSVPCLFSNTMMAHLLEFRFITRRVNILALSVLSTFS